MYTIRVEGYQQFGKFKKKSNAEAYLESLGYEKERGPLAFFFVKRPWRARIVWVGNEKAYNILYLPA